MTRFDRAVRVVDSSEVASARRIASQLAATLRLDETSRGKAALVATELATNLVKHGGGGSMLFGADETSTSISMIAFDKGRGIANLSEAMQDGYSTAGSPGTGLGAIARAATVLETYSLPDRGAVVFCRIDADSPRPQTYGLPSRIIVAGICLPKPGEEVSGDAWSAVASSEGMTIAVVDGLGHGEMASEASSAGVRAFADRPDQPLDRLFAEMHGVLRPTRGAAVGIARIEAAHGRLDFCGVGNIAGTITSDDAARRVVSLGGIVGHEMRKVQTFAYPWAASSVLVMQSDGVSASWTASAYPGLLQRDPAVIAAVLYRDHCRGNDDATVVVARAS